MPSNRPATPGEGDPGRIGDGVERVVEGAVAERRGRYPHRLALAGREHALVEDHAPRDRELDEPPTAVQPREGQVRVKAEGNGHRHVTGDRELDVELQARSDSRAASSSACGKGKPAASSGQRA